MNLDYIRGAKDRARKLYLQNQGEQYEAGYSWMTDLLSPIESEIVLLAIKYKVIAEEKIRKLEEQFHDCGVRDSPTSPSLQGSNDEIIATSGRDGSI